MTELAAVAVRRRAQRGGRLARARADAGRAAGRPDPRAGQQGVAGRRRPAGAGGAKRPGQIVPVDSEHSALAQCLRSGTGARGAAAGPDRERRTVPGPRREPSSPTSRPSRRWPTRPGTWARSSRSTRPRMVNKGLEVIEAHELFGVAVRRHRGHGAPAVGDPLDGRVRRRLDARPGQPAGHAAADRAGAGLARPGAGRGRRGATGPRPHTWEFAPARRRGVPGRTRWPRPPVGPGAAGRRSTTRPTRSAWPRSPTGRLPFLGHRRHRCSGCSTRRPTSPNQVPSMTCSRPSRGRGRRRAS